ncbi:hypothetical protein MUB24_07815 [Lederbergia sp. NSJ-179]|uniref:hypothetical protein n=1 Tax=Lederbergia sp. NSJ-179 TaxID=2931402 RepID=UPI001FD1CF14|nr:hypothetical protein [Lederbergia sp. NSJ-179]MCJ7840812.1 hypothetical protein [Lederbergia sp. NSJ-179]
MSKKETRNHNEEYGMEFGDINAVKYYELPEETKKGKRGKKDKEKNRNECS